MKWITAITAITAINSPLNLFLFTIVILGSPVTTAPIANVTEWSEVTTPDVMPECGAACLISIMPHIVCASPGQNATCSPCASKEVADLLQTCLLQTCKLSIVETFRVRRNFNTRCHNPVVSRVASLRALSVSFLSSAFICIFLRFYTRWDQGIFNPDDWLMLVCFIVLIPYTILDFLMMHYGFGRNMWDLEPINIDSAFKVFNARINVYFMLVALPKISMLLFYIRLIPSTTCKRLAYLLIFFVSVTMIVWLGLVNTFCTPISYLWNGWRGTSKAHCRTGVKQFDIHAYINLFQESFVLLLPLPWLFRLEIKSKKRKVGLLVLFSCGILTCTVSIVRLVVMSTDTEIKNDTWDFVDSLNWTTVETCLNVIIPNLPAMRTLMSRKLPRLVNQDYANRDQNIHKLNSFFRAKMHRTKSRSRMGITKTESMSCDIAKDLYGSDVSGQDAEKGFADTSNITDMSEEPRKQGERKDITIRESVQGKEEET